VVVKVAAHGGRDAAVSYDVDSGKCNVHCFNVCLGIEDIASYVGRVGGSAALCSHFDLSTNSTGSLVMSVDTQVLILYIG
jgi:hypothetical protein